MRYIYLVLIFSLLVAGAWAGPPSADSVAQTESMTAAPIRLFQRFLSRADGHRCPMTPSCSSYALQAMQRHGALIGWIMANDRLMRCGRDELKHSPPVMTRNGVRYRDTVEDNAFWWH